MNENKKLFYVQGVDGYILGTNLVLQSQGVLIADNEEISAIFPIGTTIIDPTKIVKPQQQQQEPQNFGPTPTELEPQTQNLEGGTC